jgi:hypothetical protein
MTETSKLEMSRTMQWIGIIGVIIGLVSLSVTIIGPSNITSFFSRLVSPPTADYTIDSYSTPQGLPSGFLYSLTPASDYYVATSISLSTNTPYVGNPFYFSVSFDNKGKKSVLEPYVMIYLSDMWSREWALWNRSLTSGEFSNGFSVAYNFPTLDKKTTGAWFVWSLLYDNSTGQLVSVNTTEFTATDNVPPPAWLLYLVFGFALAITIVVVIATFRKIIKDRKIPKARIKRRKEKEANRDKKEETEKGSGS